MRIFELFGEITREDLYEQSSFTQGTLEKYFNYLIRRTSSILTYDEIRKCLSNIMSDISDISGELNVFSGHTISYLDILKVGHEEPKLIKELFHPEIRTGQYKEIENQFAEQGNKLINYYKEHPERELHPFVKSGTGINKKQFTQCCSFVGLKPDIDGSVIPVVVKDNFMSGLKSLESYYINAKGTRLALLTNKNMTKRSGYLTRKLYLSNIDHYHDNNVEDCGTTHFLIYNIENEKRLSLIADRHYYEINEKGERISELKTIDRNDKSLIGKTIGLRSPVTCKNKHTCKTCYGSKLSEINKDVNTGLVAVLRLTEPLTQKLLSSKHLLTTNSEEVNWGPDFSELFSVNMDTISFRDDVESSITFQRPTEYNEDQEAYTIDEFVINQFKKSVEYKSPVKLFINNKLLPIEKMKSDDHEITISPSDIESEDYVFKFEPKNNAITKSLQQILDLIESNDHLGIQDYNEFVGKFCDLLIENEMDFIRSVHIEMISSRLIREKGTLKPLDFSKKELDDYEIIRVSKSDMLAPLSISLSFERIPEQLVDLKTYEKDEVSMMDYLFR